MKFSKRTDKFLSAALIGFMLGSVTLLPNEAYAKSFSRNISRSHVKNFNRGGNKSIDRSRDIKIKRDRDVNINIDRDVHVNGRPYYGRPHQPNYDRPHHGHGHHHGHGVSTGAAVAIGLTGLAVGAMIASSQLPPSCQMITVRGLTYQQCGNTWYQPQYMGSELNYIVVNPPY